MLLEEFDDDGELQEDILEMWKDKHCDVVMVVCLEKKESSAVDKLSRWKYLMHEGEQEEAERAEEEEEGTGEVPSLSVVFV